MDRLKYMVKVWPRHNSPEATEAPTPTPRSRVMWWKQVPAVPNRQARQAVKTTITGAALSVPVAMAISLDAWAVNPHFDPGFGLSCASSPRCDKMMQMTFMLLVGLAFLIGVVGVGVGVARLIIAALTTWKRVRTYWTLMVGKRK